MHATRKFVRLGAGLACLAALGACSSADSELDRFIEETRRMPGGRVEPLPEVKPYESHTYSVAHMRSPFEPGRPSGRGGAADVRPDTNRNREFLEQFPLDTLRMVGTLQLGGRTYGLVQTRDGLVHRVTVGNYLGQSDGRVVAIEASRITLIEIVPDGLGGYMERPAAMALDE